MRKNPLLTHVCGVCLEMVPEDQTEMQWRYGDPPWHVCHGCFAAGKNWVRTRPEATFAPVAQAKEPGLFDDLFEE